MQESLRLDASDAIKQSIVHRNTTPANNLLHRASQRDRNQLVFLFETFGNLVFSTIEKRLVFVNRFQPAAWDGVFMKAILEWGQAPQQTAERKTLSPSIDVHSSRKARTAFDRAGARSTRRATKYAKQRPDSPTS
jgi:hypothetical protein